MQSTITGRPGLGAPQAHGQRFNKACDSCHISKVRCMPDPHAPTGTCKRCSKNGLACIFSPVGPRRRPVRTKNERIAELERRVKDMQLKLEREVEKRGAGGGNSALSPRHEPPDRNHDPASSTDSRTTSASGLGGPNFSAGPTAVTVLTETGVVDSRDATPAEKGENYGPHQAATARRPVASTASTSSFQIQRPGTPNLDVIERGLLTEGQADKLIREFRARLNGKFLGIYLPSDLGDSRLRREKPAFWLSVLCAASASSSVFCSLARMLFHELKEIVDGRIRSGVEPDLDALQALVNYVCFHHDPMLPLGGQLLGVYSAAIKMAVQMAERSPLHALPASSPMSEESVTEGDIQLSRELLHWYWASFSLTVKARQSTMLRQTHLVEASVRILETTQNVNDMSLIQWVNLVRIAAEAVLALHRGHTQESAGLSDEARDGILGVFEKKRKRWLVECPFDLVNEPLMLEYHYLVVLVSEVIYPAGPADFTFRSHGLPSLSPSTSIPLPDQNFLAPYKLRYTRNGITAAHACLDLATRPPEAYHVETCASEDLLRCFGVLPHVRVFYALRFLLFVAHEVWRTGRHDLVDIGALKLEDYISALKRCLAAASSGGKYRAPSLWLYALETRIEPWYRRLYALLQRDRPLDQAQADSEGGQIPRPTSNEALPSTGEIVEPEARGQGFNTLCDTVTDIPLSTLLLDSPFELISTPDMLTEPSSNAVSYDNISRHKSTGGSHMILTSHSITPSKGEAPSTTTTTRSTQTSFEPLRDSTTQSIETSGNLQSRRHGSQTREGNGGDLDTWFGNMSEDLDPFTLNWDYLNEVLPGSESLFPALSPCASVGTAQHVGVDEGLDGRGEA